MRRWLKIVMSLLMITVVYGIFYYRTLPATTMVQESTVIVVDPGHGGDDPGKVGITNALEKDINLSLARKLKKALEQEGYRVVLTRDNDDGLYNQDAHNKKLADLKKRCAIIEQSGAQLAISIHQNSFGSESVHGAQVFYYKYSVEGKRLAESIQSSLRDEVDPDNMRTAKDNSTYYMLVHTVCPTVIVECGFLSNPDEEQKLLKEEYQEQLSQAICKGVQQYFSNQKK